MALKDGLQVPVIELVEEVGKDKLVPMQISVGKLNVGLAIGFTVIVLVTVLAHNPTVGVKVYVVV